MLYHYCSVLPVNHHTVYSYIADFEIQAHAFVEIPFGPDNELTYGFVVEVTDCTEKTAPFPVEKTKHIVRLVTRDDFESRLKPALEIDPEDYEDEIDEVNELIIANDFDGMFHWAVDHHDCIENPFIMEKVLECYKLCVEENNPLAALNLGTMYYNGTFVQRDYKKAAALYEIAAKAGERQALTNLVYCFYYGRHQEKDYAMAMQYFMLGAILYDDANCLYKLGDLYKDGKFVPKNSVYAFKLYNHAFNALRQEEDENIEPDIRFRLGEAFLHGVGITPDIHLAFNLLSQALSGFYDRRKTDPFVGSLIKRTKDLLLEAEALLDQEVI